MARQLSLLDPSTDWRLDDRTREVGRRGVAQARAALAAAHPRSTEQSPASTQHRPAA